MTVVTYGDGTEKRFGAVESMTRLWVSPSTMDSNDTVVVPTVTGATVSVINCFDTTTGDAVTATVSGYTVTIDAAGSATDAAYALLFTYLQG